MNDFTKAELECLHNAIVLQLRDIPMSETNAIRRSELMGKLQSMIDNYNALETVSVRGEERLLSEFVDE